MLRMQVRINTTGMDLTRLSGILSCIMDLWGRPAWFMDFVSVVYTGPAKSIVSICYGEYTIECVNIKDDDWPDRFNAAFVRRP